MQDELDLGWLDYGARMYLPEIGRWGSIDRYAAAYYAFTPYNYVTNNPIVFVDIEGRFKVPIHRKILKIVLQRLGYENTWFGARVVAGGTHQADYVGMAASQIHFDGKKDFKAIYNAWNTLNDQIKSWSGEYKATTTKEEHELYLGVLLHSVQDFYAHSNYVELFTDYYLEKFGMMPSSIEIPTFDEAVASPAYRMFREDYLEKQLMTGEFNLIRWFGGRDRKKTNKEGHIHHDELAKDDRKNFKVYSGTSLHDAAVFLATVHSMNVMSNVLIEPTKNKQKHFKGKKGHGEW